MSLTPHHVPGLTCACPLQWRHNERDGGSNQQSQHCLLNRLFRRRSKKTSKLSVTGLCGEFTGDRWIPRTNGLQRGKCFHLMTSSLRASTNVCLSTLQKCHQYHNIFVSRYRYNHDCLQFPLSIVIMAMHCVINVVSPLNNFADSSSGWNLH